jgi:hypothetical protein
VTGKHAEAVLVTGLGKAGEYLPLVEDPEGTVKDMADEGLWANPFPPEGVEAKQQRGQPRKWKVTLLGVAFKLGPLMPRLLPAEMDWPKDPHQPCL